MAEACLSRSCRILLAFCLTYTAQVMVSSIFGSFLGGLFKLEYRIPKPSIDILTAYFLPCRSASWIFARRRAIRFIAANPGRLACAGWHASRGSQGLGALGRRWTWCGDTGPPCPVPPCASFGDGRISVKIGTQRKTPLMRAASVLGTTRIGVVGCARLELATNGLKVRCSTD